MINWTSVKLSDLNKHRYTRLDAKYWIQKSLLKKKRKNSGNIMTPSVIEDFNKMVDKVTDVIQTKDDGKFKTFDDYLKIKSTNETK